MHLSIKLFRLIQLTGETEIMNNETKHTPELVGFHKWHESYVLAYGRKLNAREVDIAASAYACGLSDAGADSPLKMQRDDLAAALRLHMKFWDDMPKGQLGKLSCDIGTLNDAFIASRKALAKVQS